MPSLPSFSDLESIAEASGGHVVVSAKPEDMARSANDLGRYLTPRYMLAYAPMSPPDGTHHKVEVRFTGNALLKKTNDKDRPRKLKELNVDVWQSSTGYTAPLHN